MFAFLRSLGLRPLEWSQAVSRTGSATPYVGEILDAAFDGARAVIVLFTPDDVTMLRDEFRVDGDPEWESMLTGQARPNVLFEAGMAFGRDDKRTLLVEFGKLRPFSDVGGRHVLRFDGTIGHRQALAVRLRDAGCEVDMDGEDWHTAGDFSYGQKAPRPAGQSEAGAISSVAVELPSSLMQLQLGLTIAPTGEGRYDLTISNNGFDPVLGLRLELDESAPFYLFSRGDSEAQLPPGGIVCVTLAALGDDAGLDHLPFHISGRVADDNAFEEIAHLTYSADKAL
ncbi:MAG: hypothetical protein QOF45_1811 [Gaiellaceae bacterium]|jgi:hypothetical protein|nr:hypothetical protein [Gaiellaceae bacterium]